MYVSRKPYDQDPLCSIVETKCRRGGSLDHFVSAHLWHDVGVRSYPQSKYLLLALVSSWSCSP